MDVLELAKLRKENDEYLKSVEWAELLVEAEEAVNDSFTVIYRDKDDELKEAWHWLSEMNIEHIKAKYKKQGKDIIRLVKKEMAFGQYLKSIHGGSDDEKR
jgi:hypothetical protein